MELTYEKDFVEKKLLAYIGNKRRLIPLILKAITEIKERGHEKINPKGWFVDYFAGTGVVSRLSKSLGFKTIANDWEHYAYIFNKGFLENCQSDLTRFSKLGGIDKALKKLNSLTKPRQSNRYFAKYYCPKNDAKANPQKERLFYTKGNGILIDNMRAEIDKMFSLKENSRIDKKRNEREKNLLLALLLYESSKRSNTSGVFKAFHNGFGGKNKDALSRILGQIELSCPELSKQKQPCKVYNLDALKLAEKINHQKAEIVYLDPPYNQHQYGSNYHLLNTIALNDKPSVNQKFMFGEKKKNKSAIRKDWVKTKSDFCYKKKASHYFEKLLEKINAKYILLSYSTEGIIPFDEILAMVSKKGKLAIVTSSYIRYRGGRQANHTEKKNIEFVIIVDTSLKNQTKDLENIKGVLNHHKLHVSLDNFFPIDKAAQLDEEFQILAHEKSKKIAVRLKKHDFTFDLSDKLTLKEDFMNSLKNFSYSKQNDILLKMKEVYHLNNSEKVNSILNIIKSDDFPVDKKYFLSELFRLFNKTKSDPVINENLKNKMLALFHSYLNSFALPKNLSLKFERLKSYT